MDNIDYQALNGVFNKNYTQLDKNTKNIQVTVQDESRAYAVHSKSIPQIHAQAKAIKDPLKLVRMATAVARTCGADTNDFYPFADALTAMGFDPIQVEQIRCADEHHCAYVNHWTVRVEIWFLDAETGHGDYIKKQAYFDNFLSDEVMVFKNKVLASYDRVKALLDKVGNRFDGIVFSIEYH